MSRYKRIFCFGFLVSILGLMTVAPLAAAEPQTQNANWDNLKKLVPGERVQAVLNDLKSYQGTFQSVSDDALVVRLASGEQTFTRQSVLRVSSKGQGHRLRNAGIGALIGVGGGAAIGAAACPCNLPDSLLTRGEAAATGTLIGAVIGAGVGAALPSSGWRVVYRAR